jgi:hypothetical protein
LVLFGLIPSAARADGADPKVKLQGGGGSTGLFSPTDPNFSFTVYGGTSPQSFDFINATGQVAGEVDLLITPNPDISGLIFTVDSPNEYFTDASVSTLFTGQTLISFFGLNTCDGCYDGLPFATDLSSVKDCGDGVPWDCSTTTAGADFQVVVEDTGGDLLGLPSGEEVFSVTGSLVPTPEPSTILLVLVGGVLVFLSKRF